jgi:CheY-like chemotaxis protein
MQKFTILVVDDDPAIRNMLNELLTAKGDYRVLVAGDSKEAVAAFYSEPRIDVILTDIHMPDHTGLEMVSDMKSVDFKPEILVMTANGNPENVEKSRKIGARSMILKPFDNLDVIEAEIAKAVEAAAEKRGEELPDEPKSIEEPTTDTIEPTERVTIEPPDEPSEKPDELLPSVPPTEIDLPERQQPVGETVATRTEPTERTPSGNRHHAAPETGDFTRDTVQPIEDKEPAPAPPTTPVAQAEEPPIPADEIALKIPDELGSIFQLGTDLDTEDLKIQVPIVCLQTVEEQEAIDTLRRLARTLKRRFYTWSATRGIVDPTGKVLERTASPQAAGFKRHVLTLLDNLRAWVSKTEGVKGRAQAHLDPISALECITAQTHDGVFILADFGRFLEDPKVARTLREMVLEGRTARTMLVLTAPQISVPAELEGSCEVFDWPQNNEQDIEAVFNEVRRAMEVTVGRPISLDASAREEILERLKGRSAGRVRFEIARELMKVPS